jgi:hypothetical protein
MFPYISHRCHRYNQRYVPLKNGERLVKFNTQMYESCGHTVTGLQSLGYAASVDKFNKYVYGCLDYGKLRILSEEQFKEDAKHMTNLLKYCANHNIDAYIFSNAPPTWINTSLYYLIEDVQRLNVSILPQTATYLKPTSHMYTMLEQTTLNSYSRIVYVDGKFINILPIVGRPKWEGVLLNVLVAS